MLYHCARDAEPVPAPVGAARPRVHDAAEPRADGFDAHRARGPRGRLPEARRLLRRARARRRRTHRDGRDRAECRRLDQAVCRNAERPPPPCPAPARDRRRARGRRAHLHADPAHGALRLSSARRCAFAPEGAHRPVRAARAVRRRGRAPGVGVRALRGARPRGRLRRHRGDGQRGLLHQPVPRIAHQPAQRPLGRQLGEPHAAAARDRGANTRRGRSGFHHRLPALDARPGRGRQRLEGDRRTGAGGRGRGRNDHQHGHRLARGAHSDDRDDGPARGVHLGDPQAQGRRPDPARHQQPHQRPGRRRTRAGGGRCRSRVHGAAAARGPGLRRQGGARSGRRDQHLHRLQSGLPRPRVRECDCDLPREPARRPRDRAGVSAGRGAEARRRRRRGTRGAFLRSGRRAARPPRDAVRVCRPDRRAVQHGQANPGQGGVPRDAALLPARARTHRRRCPPRARRHGRRARGRRIRRSRPRDGRAAPRTGDPRARYTGKC